MAYADDVRTERSEGLEKYAGVRFLRDGSKHVVCGLGGQKGRTIFRIYPEIADGREMPQRRSSNANDFTYWMRPEKSVHRMGVKGDFSVFVRPAGKDQRYQGPIERFVWTLKRAFKEVGSETIFPAAYRQWEKMGGGLPLVEYRGLLQGMLFENQGKTFMENGVVAPLHPVLLMCNKSARNALEDACNQEVNPSAERLVDKYFAGDLTSVAGGRAIALIYHPQSGQTLSHYGLTVCQQPTPLDLGMVVSEWMPWDDLLFFYTEEEQMNLLLEYFPQDIVDYVFGGTNLYPLLPSSVRGLWARRCSGQAPQPHPNPNQMEQIEVRDDCTFRSPSIPAAPAASVPPAPAPAARPIAMPMAPVVTAAPMARPGPVIAAPVIGVPATSAGPQAPVFGSAIGAVKSPLVAHVPDVQSNSQLKSVEGEVIGGQPAAPIGDPAVDRGRESSIRERLRQAQGLDHVEVPY